MTASVPLHIRAAAELERRRRKRARRGGQGEPSRELAPWMATFEPAARYKVAWGGRGCVHPDTLIDTPSGQVRVREFSGGPVYSWKDGHVVVAEASPARPFTVESLYEVTLENGSSIIATDEHKFLTPTGWKRLADLSHSAAVVVRSPVVFVDHAQTFFSPARLASRQDALSLTGIREDCSVRCSEYSRQCDLQPRVAQGIARGAPPSLSDALRRTLHALIRAGGRWFARIGSPLRSSRHPSTQAVLRGVVVQGYEESEIYTGEKSSALLLASYQSKALSHANKALERQERVHEEQRLGVLPCSSLARSLQRFLCRLLRVVLGNSLRHPNEFSPDFIVSEVASICYHSRQTYWDLTVYGTQNYLSNGIVNHNSGKSWSFARKLLLLAAERPLRVLCARELQISIKDSVHRLLADQVDAMGLSERFEVGQSFIRGNHDSNRGAEFIFKGLRHNAAEIKSMEGIDICWVEEAQAVSDQSWELLIPTIRAPGSEIWITFNPDQATDPTYKRFVTTPPPGAIVRRVNWDENPWFPPDLEAERAHKADTDPDGYRHVWLGECRSYSDAQVLNGKWIVDAFEPAADWDGPYQGADWGFAKDPTVLVRCWIHDRDLYIEHEAYGVEVPLDDTPALFERVPDARAHPIRADCARPETINHLVRHGWENVTAAPKWSGSVQDGVEFLRSFERIVIHQRCKHAAEEARLWSFKTDRLTGDVLPVLIDGNDHCFDAIRYSLSPIIRERRGAFWFADTGAQQPDQLATLHARIDEATPAGTCGTCDARENGRCRERGLIVQATDPGCEFYLAVS